MSDNIGGRESNAIQNETLKQLKAIKLVAIIMGVLLLLAVAGLGFTAWQIHRSVVNTDRNLQTITDYFMSPDDYSEYPTDMEGDDELTLDAGDTGEAIGATGTGPAVDGADLDATTDGGDTAADLDDTGNPEDNAG